MKIPQLPWSAIVAGGSSGMAGFALMALATGTLHLGSAHTCSIADHRSGSTLARTQPTGTDPEARHDHPGNSCCCSGGPTGLTTARDETPTQLTPIKVTATPTRAFLGCEDETGLPPLEIVMNAADDTMATLENDQPLQPIITPTRFVATGFDPEAAPALAVGTSPAAMRSISMLDGLTGSSSLWSAGGSGGGGGGGFGAAGGSAAGQRAATNLADAGSVTPALVGGLIVSPSLAEGLTYRLSHLHQLGIASVPSGTLVATRTTLTEPVSLAQTTDQSLTPLTSSDPTSPVATVSVPEPASVVLSIVGLSLAGFAARRRGQVSG